MPSTFNLFWQKNSWTPISSRMRWEFCSHYQRIWLFLTRKVKICHLNFIFSDRKNSWTPISSRMWSEFCSHYQRIWLFLTRNVKKRHIHFNFFGRKNPTEHRFLQECDQNSAQIIKGFGFSWPEISRSPIYISTFLIEKIQLNTDFFKNVIIILNRKAAKVY